MSSLGSKIENISDKFVENCLSYIDLIRKVIVIENGRNPDYSTVENELNHLRSKLLKNKRAGLIIESSPTIAAMCQNALADLPLQLTLIDDGLKALERLLHEKYDFIITARTLKTINGVALISALRASETVNKNIKVIMLTSTVDNHFPIGAQPDQIIKRDPQLASILPDIVKNIIVKT